MKSNFLFLMLFSLSVLIVSCDKNDDDDELYGNWTELSDFDGIPRGDAVGFVIDSKAYIGTGYDGKDRLKDFWQYDPAINAWTQKADFPGTARNGAIGMAIENKGYIGTGYNGDVKMNDFWQYDPSSNTWTQKADFTGTARYGAISFSIGNKGYVGTGYDDNYLKDFYAYSPSTDSWEKIVSIGGSKRRDAAAFVIGNKAYVVSGLDNGTYLNDVWEFDASSGLWTEKRKITNYTDEKFDNEYTTIARMNHVAFTVNGKGYIACGSTGSLVNTVWEYDSQNDLWKERTSFEGSARTEGVGFAIGSKGYVTTGRSSSYYFDDIWSFDPTAEYDERY